MDPPGHSRAEAPGTPAGRGRPALHRQPRCGPERFRGPRFDRRRARRTSSAREPGRGYLPLRHAPCGGAAGSDPAFPEPDGGTGVRGCDFRGKGRIVETSAPDLTAYCRPHRVSDCHFAYALRCRPESEAGSGSAPGASDPLPALLIWGASTRRVNCSRSPRSWSTLHLCSPPDGGDDCPVTGTTAEGRKLFPLRFDMPEVEDGDGCSGFTFALPVEPRLGGFTRPHHPGRPRRLERREKDPAEEEVGLVVHRGRDSASPVLLAAPATPASRSVADGAAPIRSCRACPDAGPARAHRLTRGHSCPPAFSPCVSVPWLTDLPARYD